MALGPAVEPGDREVLERHGFKMETPYMEVPRCETCRWWERLDGSVGVCRRAGAVTADGEPVMLVSGDGRLLTAPSFGCVQWEDKE